MKKIFLSTLCLVALSASLLVASCSKSSSTAKTTTVTCTDSAYLMPDSLLACSATAVSSYKMFYILATHRDVLVPKGTFTDIDTVVNGGSYIITFDSTGTVPLCGVVVTKGNLTCRTKL